jgi:hypothetical protein
VIPQDKEKLSNEIRTHPDMWFLNLLNSLLPSFHRMACEGHPTQSNVGAIMSVPVGDCQLQRLARGSINGGQERSRTREQEIRKSEVSTEREFG